MHLYIAGIVDTVLIQEVSFTRSNNMQNNVCLNWCVVGGASTKR